jgi:hypothetical protein
MMTIIFIANLDIRVEVVAKLPDREMTSMTLDLEILILIGSLMNMEMKKM